MLMEKTSLESAATTLPISASAKAQLLSSLWGVDISPEDIRQERIQTDAFLDFYSEQCELFAVEQSCGSPSGSSKHCRIATHRDLISVAGRLAGTTDRHVIVQDLHYANAQPAAAQVDDGAITDVAENRAIHTSIDWAARMLSMVEIGALRCAFSSRRPLLWEDGSLSEFLARMFAPSSKELSIVRFEKSFHARNLARLAGIEIEWTSDLASHLSLREDDQKLLIFHHATFLENTNVDIFPPNLLSETLQTLALLLPSSDAETRAWYRKQSRSVRLDPAAVSLPRLRTENRQINNFHYWRERLVILKQVYDDAEPSTLTQWWYDRRKGPQWYTFWVAIAVLALTIFFGIIQSVEGALQVYKAWYP